MKMTTIQSLNTQHEVQIIVLIELFSKMTPTFLQKIRKELHLSNCGFNYTEPHKFVRSQWQLQTKNVFYLLWRIVVGTFFLAAVIDSMVASITAHDFGFYFIYLTNWGIILCMITSVYGAILVSYWHFHPTYAGTMPISATNVLTHACNSVLMFLDMLIMAYPLRLYHVIQPLLLGLVYVVFSVIYYAAGGKDKFGHPYIYNVLDWSSSDPTKNAVTVVGTFLLSMAIHLVLFGVFRLREFVHRKCVRTEEAILPVTPLAASNSKISMVLGSYEYNNNGFSGSTEKI
ncbi:Protein rolling stone, partial [Pseudolycoriella hygida]